MEEIGEKIKKQNNKIEETRRMVQLRNKRIGDGKRGKNGTVESLKDTKNESKMKENEREWKERGRRHKKMKARGRIKGGKKIEN